MNNENLLKEEKKRITKEVLMEHFGTPNLNWTKDVAIPKDEITAEDVLQCIDSTLEHCRALNFAGGKGFVFEMREHGDETDFELDIDLPDCCTQRFRLVSEDDAIAYEQLHCNLKEGDLIEIKKICRS